MSNIELARRMGRDEKAIRRLRDLLHRSHIDQVEAALRILGARVIVEVETADPPPKDPAVQRRAA